MTKDTNTTSGADARTKGQQNERATMLVIYPRKQLTKLDKARMEAHGILAIEADDPSAVVEIQPATHFRVANVSGDAILRCALTAIANSPPATATNDITAAGRIAHKFVTDLAASMKGTAP